MPKFRGCAIFRTRVIRQNSGITENYNREFKQITTAGTTTAAVTEKAWGEYVSVVCQILTETSAKEFKTLFSLVSRSQMAPLKGRWPLFAFLGRTDYF